jgi:hypothetical protein
MRRGRAGRKREDVIGGAREGGGGVAVGGFPSYSRPGNNPAKPTNVAAGAKVESLLAQAAAANQAFTASVFPGASGAVNANPVRSGGAVPNISIPLRHRVGTGR